MEKEFFRKAEHRVKGSGFRVLDARYRMQDTSKSQLVTDSFVYAG